MMSRYRWMLSLLILSALILSACQPIQAPVEPTIAPTAQRTLLPPLPKLDSVWGSSGNDVFAVGNDGTILHYDGSDWSLMSSGTTVEICNVWGNTGSDVFAVGFSGTILHLRRQRLVVCEKGPAP